MFLQLAIERIGKVKMPYPVCLVFLCLALEESLLNFLCCSLMCNADASRGLHSDCESG